jgi:hypothetical protein
MGVEVHQAGQKRGTGKIDVLICVDFGTRRNLRDPVAVNQDGKAEANTVIRAPEARGMKRDGHAARR